MASSTLLRCMPHPTTASATFTADPILRPRQDFPLLRSNPSSSVTYKQPNILDPSKRDLISRTISPKPIASRLASAWREIQGLNDWEDLLDPLHPLLRNEVIRYGEFVAACYEAFDLDPHSKRYLNCKYGRRTMLREVGLGESGYEVTKYIYATAPDVGAIPIQTDPEARWIGYVAASSDDEVANLGRRDIVITFRGTVTNPEWMANLMSSLTPARLDPQEDRPEVKVEAGFLSLYTNKESSRNFGLESCREQLLSEVSRLLKKYKNEEVSISIAGHSMGSSLAHLLAYDIAELGLNRPNGAGAAGKEIPVTVFSFGGPRVGNSGFKDRCEELGVKVLRVVNVNDPITKLPGVLFNENLKGLLPWSCACYSHVGVELVVDFFKMNNPSCVHDLGNYISLLRCPKSWQKDRERVSLMERAKGFVSGGRRSFFDALQWQNAAISMLSVVQSQWI